MALINDIRDAELTYGAEWITVCLSGDKVVYIRNLSLREIFDPRKLGISNYFHWCSISNYGAEKPSNLTEKEEKEYKNQIELFRAAFLKLFVMCDNVQSLGDSNYRLVIGEDFVSISEDELYMIFDAFREIYYLSSGKQPFADLVAKTERGKKGLEMFRKAKAADNARQHGEHTIWGIILGVATHSHSYNLLNIWDLKMWQLMKTHSQMFKNDNIYFTKLAIYTGNMDTSKNKIKPKELDWSIVAN